MTRDEFLRCRLIEDRQRLIEYEALWEKYNLLSHFDRDGFERMYFERLAVTVGEMIDRLAGKINRTAKVVRVYP